MKANILSICMSVVLILSTILQQTSSAQVINADYEIAKPPCTDEPLIINNLSTNATSYFWDFCIGDLKNTPSVSLLSAQIKKPYKTEITESNGDYFGFVTSRTNNTLYRLDFTDSTLQDFSFIDLEISFSNLLSISVFEINELWYGLMISFDNEVIRLNFGTSLLNTPTIEQLGDFGLLNNPTDIIVIQKPDSVMALITNFSSNSISRIIWNSTFSIPIFQDNLILSGASQLGGLSIIKENTEWVSFATARGNNKVFKIRLGENMANSNPVVSELTDLGFPLVNPGGISTHKEGDNYYHFIQSSSGDLYRIEDGLSLLDNSIDNSENFGNFDLLDNNWGLNLYRINSEWVGFSSSNSGNNLYRFSFPNSCNILTDFSKSVSPQNIHFSSSGIYEIELIAFNSGSNSSVTKTISVSSDTPPDISFSSQNICAQNPIGFTTTNTSGDIASYAWDFGDSNSATTENPSNIYTTNGTYDVNLTVTSSAGCTNTATSSLTVYDPPVASFDLPTSSICTNLDNVFTNTTNDNFDGNLTYDWEVDGVSENSDRNFTRAFATSGNADIMLTTSIPGCSNNVTQNVAIFAGPSVDFNLADNCQGVITDFTNQTTGDNITNYAWDFGNASGTSSDLDPSYLYPIEGTFNVKLDVTNAAGCVNTATKPITIYKKAPTPVFALSETIHCKDLSEMYTNSTDESGFIDGEISYLWNFDNEKTSSLIDTTYTFSTAGTKLITLTAQTPDNCEVSSIQNITVNESSVVDFNLADQCQGVATNFTNQTTGDNITNYAWDFGNTSGNSTDTDPSYLYPVDGTFNVKLDVTNAAGCVNTASKPITIFKKAPTPVFGLSETIHCKDLSEMYTNSTDESGFIDGEISYLWNFDNEKTSSLIDTTYSFSTAGTKLITLTAQTPDNCEVSTVQNITVNESSVVDFNLADNCQGVITDFTNQTTGDNITNYAWDFGNTSGNSTDTDPSYLYPVDGTFNVKLDVTNAAGCVNTATKPITIYKKAPTPVFGLSETIHCKDLSEMYTNSTDESGFIDGEISYLWNFDNEKTSSQIDTTFSFATAGTKQITLTAQTLDNCEISTIQNITVNENSVVDFNLSDNCQGVATAFTNQTTGNSIINYAWDFGNASGNSTDLNPSYLYPLEGTFNVKLDVTNAAGCVNTATKSITIFKKAPTPIFEISETIHCKELSEFYTNSTDETGFIDGEISYLWNFDNEKISSQIDTTYTFSTAGTKQITLTAQTLDNCEISAVQNITVNENSLVSFDLSNNCQGIATAITNQTTGVGNLNYEWDFGDGLGTSNNFNPNYIYPNNGNYSVNLKVTNQAGCVNDLNKSITILKAAPTPVFSLSETVHCTDLTESLINLTDESDFNANEVSYLWIYDDIQISDQKDLSYTFTSAETKPLTLISSTLDNCESTSTEIITVNEKSLVDFNLSNNCQGEATPFSNLTTGVNLVDFTWDFGDGSGTSSSFAPSYLYPNKGDYTITLEVTNQAGCVNNASKAITIFKKAPTPTFTSSQEVHCSGVSEFYTNSTDESEFNPNEISYVWNFDNEVTSTQKDTTYTFNSAGLKALSLTTTTPDNCTAITNLNLEINESPSTAFQFSDNCIGESTLFTNLSTGPSIDNYLWDFGDGVTNSNLNPEHSYSSPGTYTVTLTSTSTSSCENILQQNITVNALPVASFTSEVGCEGQEVNFINTTTVEDANIESWTWDFAGLGTSNEEKPRFTFNTTGNFLVTLTATSNFGCVSTKTQNITINASPKPDFESVVGCLNTTTIFTDMTNSVSGNPISSWFWELDNQVFTSQNVEHIFTQAGVYNISLTVTPQNACAIQVNKQITIDPLPIVDFSFLDNCDNQFVTFNDESTSDPSPIISRIWDFDGQNSANGSGAAFQFASAGIYDVTLAVQTETGCTNKITQQVEIHKSPTASFTPSTTLGPPQLEVLFMNTSINADSYKWSFKDLNNSTSIEESPPFIFTELGNYEVELIASNALGCSDTTVNEISVVQPDLNLTLSKIESSLDNGNIRISLTVENEGTIDVDGFDVMIDLENDLSFVEAYHSKLNAQESATFTLNFEIPAINNKIGSVCFTIQESDPLYDETDFSTNEGCINFGTEAAIENPFPNPTTDEINLNMVLPDESTLEIGLINTYGETLYSQNYSNLLSGLNSFRINTANYKKGIYFLRIIHNGKAETRRIVKQ